MFLESGQRGFLCGKTGSGKTEGGMFQVINTELWPRIIFDTKIEDKFFSLPSGSETLEVIEGLDNFQLFAKESKKKMDEFPDYVLVRPTLHEYVEPEILDEYCRVVYENFGKCLFYIDEVANLHKNGRALPHLMNILCRGRSKGKTTLMGSQRPANISRSCLTEADKFYMYRLTDQRDKITLGNVVPDFEKSKTPPKWHFWFYDMADDDNGMRLFKPVPLLQQTPIKIFSKKWI